MGRDFALVLPLVLALLLGAVNPVLADSAFDRLARTLEERLHLQREHIPAGWLVNTVLFVSRPAGVKHLELAVFEDFDGDDQRLVREFESTVDEALGKGWRPWVRTVSRRDGERTLIYAKPDGKNWELFVATMERSEATVIRIKVNARRMAEYIEDHHRVDLGDRER